MCFCQAGESIEHLFISCPLTLNIWRLIHFAQNISPPTCIANMFGNWLVCVHKKIKDHIQIGVCAFIQVIQNCRNDVIFYKIRVVRFQIVH